MIDFDEHVKKSFKRLCDREYGVPDVYQPLSYSWQGDWEGRALLAHCRLYELTGEKTPALDDFIKMYSEKANADGYLGNLFDASAVDEQQLSGHSWLLCGMVEYCKLFRSEIAEKAACDIFDRLYKKARNSLKNYPVKRERIDVGDVSGDFTGRIVNNWKLSTDVGCFSMCIDGTSRYYELTRRKEVKDFVDEAIETFERFDKRGERAQTHTTLTAARGIFRMYKLTGDRKYYDKALAVFRLYIDYGMTYTYENFNWFERKDTWTEPCAVADSFILAKYFYSETGEKEYLTLLRRIWFNGLNHCQRDNGGVGTSKTVYEKNAFHCMAMYEAPFCCTMRYCEGLYEASEVKDLLSFDESAPILTDENGRRFKDDALIVTDESGQEIYLFDLALQGKNGKKYKVF